MEIIKRNSRSIFKILQKMEKWKIFILLNVCLILIFTMVTIKSATMNKGNSFLIKEGIAAAIGIVVYISISFFDYKKIQNYTLYIYILNILLLVSVLIFGDSRLGAKRWIDLGFISLQPSEISKILTIITLSDFVSKNYNRREIGFGGLLGSFLYILPTFLLIVKQPDLSTALVILLIYATVMFVGNLKIKYIISSIVGVLIIIPISFKFFLRDYQKQRILTFLNPESDLLGAGWNVTQSKIAIGSGGVFGKGFLQNTQSKLRFLPESHTDFIGAVFFEEWGLIFGVIFLLLYMTLILQIVWAAIKTEDRFGKYICYSVAIVFLFHALVNLGMIMGIMPVTGLPLLFVSYGGTSIVLSFVLIGLVQSVNIHKDK